VPVADFGRRCPVWVDTVEKVFWERGPEFSGAVDALHARQGEGPRRFLEKRPSIFVSTLRSIAAVESTKSQLLRDF
jgi:hypothetical protein